MKSAFILPNVTHTRATPAQREAINAEAITARRKRRNHGCAKCQMRQEMIVVHNQRRDASLPLMGVEMARYGGKKGQGMGVRTYHDRAQISAADSSGAN